MRESNFFCATSREGLGTEPKEKGQAQEEAHGAGDDQAYDGCGSGRGWRQASFGSSVLGMDLDEESLVQRSLLDHREVK